jgi:hypothetical protein
MRGLLQERYKVDGYLIEKYCKEKKVPNEYKYLKLFQ